MPHYVGHRQRLRRRFMRAADEGGVTDYELMELVLFRAIARRDVKPLAKKLIEVFGSFAEAINAPINRLYGIPGVGESVIVEFKIVRNAAVELTRAKAIGRPILSGWRALIDYCSAAMAYNDIEQFRILFLDSKNILIADEAQQKGTVNHTPVYPREVVKRALELNACALILVHNHPSGDPTPSSEDIHMTNTIVETAKPLHIAIHDHIIIGKGQHLSFRRMGFL